MVVPRLRAAAAEGVLPPTCDKTWIDKGIYEDEALNSSCRFRRIG